MLNLLTSPNLMELEIAKGILDDEGIPSTIRNSFISTTQGLAGTFDWPQLWVLSDADLPAAQAALANAQETG